MRARLHRWGCLCALVSAGLSASLCVAQVAPGALGNGPPIAGIAEQTIGPGYRRVFVDQVQPLSREQLARRIEANKPTELDPATGNMIVRTFVDQLPADWLRERPEALAGQRVDSFGNPIVNDTPGLPAWAQRDVDALRAAVAASHDELARQRAMGTDIREAEGILGNFIGQAVTRAVDIGDLVNLDQVSDGVAASVLNYLHYYENLRFANQEVFRYHYVPAVYPASVAAFAERHGRTLASLQALEPAGFSPRGFACYTRQELARGMTFLSGQTDLWVTNGFDDVSADVPTGFPIFWYMACQSLANNDAVRVSTNGYISFFQQGGGAQLGTNFVNAAIPSADDPDGFAAPWWDDLIVAANQGDPDRVSYKTEGAIDQRVFTVEWFSMSRLAGDSGDFHYFQVKLYETSGVIDFQYSDIWIADSVDGATVGIEDLDGANGVCGPNCGSTNSTEPPSNYRFAPLRPFNDSCATPEEVISGSREFGDLRSASADGDALCGTSSNNRDLWYTYTSPCAGTLVVSACGSRNEGGSGAGVDTVVSIHSGCPGNISNQIACNDDGGLPTCNGLDSFLQAHLAPAQTVLIRLTHFGDAAQRLGNGRFDLSTDFVPDAPADNDQCANAILLRPGDSLEGSLLCASNDGSGGCGSSETNADVWYSFTALRQGSLTVNLCGSRDFAGIPDSGIDGVLSIHSGCPGTIGNQLACNDDGFMPGCVNLDSNVSTNLTAGQHVLIRVSHYGSDTARIGNGRFAVHAIFQAPCGSADFNGDGDIGTDADISAFFACLAGNCCATCGSADFNGDGDTGTDLDIESFFSVLGGGSC